MLRFFYYEGCQKASSSEGHFLCFCEEKNPALHLSFEHPQSSLLYVTSHYLYPSFDCCFKSAEKAIIVVGVHSWKYIKSIDKRHVFWCDLSLLPFDNTQPGDFQTERTHCW